jgi:hypothetical protein
MIAGTPEGSCFKCFQSNDKQPNPNKEQKSVPAASILDAGDAPECTLTVNA